MKAMGLFQATELFKRIREIYRSMKFYRKIFLFASFGAGDNRHLKTSNMRARVLSWARK